MKLFMNNLKLRRGRAIFVLVAALLPFIACDDGRNDFFGFGAGQFRPATSPFTRNPNSTNRQLQGIQNTLGGSPTEGFDTNIYLQAQKEAAARDRLQKGLQEKYPGVTDRWPFVSFALQEAEEKSYFIEGAKDTDGDGLPDIIETAPISEGGTNTSPTIYNGALAFVFKVGPKANLYNLFALDESALEKALEGAVDPPGGSGKGAKVTAWLNKQIDRGEDAEADKYNIKYDIVSKPRRYNKMPPHYRRALNARMPATPPGGGSTTPTLSPSPPVGSGAAEWAFKDSLELITGGVAEPVGIAGSPYLGDLENTSAANKDGGYVMFTIFTLMAQGPAKVRFALLANSRSLLIVNNEVVANTAKPGDIVLDIGDTLKKLDFLGIDGLKTGTVLFPVTFALDTIVDPLAEGVGQGLWGFVKGFGDADEVTQGVMSRSIPLDAGESIEVAYVQHIDNKNNSGSKAKPVLVDMQYPEDHGVGDGRGFGYLEQRFMYAFASDLFNVTWGDVATEDGSDEFDERDDKMLEAAIRLSRSERKEIKEGLKDIEEIEDAEERKEEEDSLLAQVLAKKAEALAEIGDGPAFELRGDAQLAQRSQIRLLDDAQIKKYLEEVFGLWAKVEHAPVAVAGKTDELDKLTDEEFRELLLELIADVLGEDFGELVGGGGDVIDPGAVEEKFNLTQAERLLAALENLQETLADRTVRSNIEKLNKSCDGLVDLGILDDLYNIKTKRGLVTEAIAQISVLVDNLKAIVAIKPVLDEADSADAERDIMGLRVTAARAINKFYQSYYLVIRVELLLIDGRMRDDYPNLHDTISDSVPGYDKRNRSTSSGGTSGRGASGTVISGYDYDYIVSKETVEQKINNVIQMDGMLQELGSGRHKCK